jgi:predicted nucleic acid binding AN1-type Zn finger protein
MNIETQTTSSKQSIRKDECAYPGETCKERVVKIIGDCKYCKKKFCSKHRMVESHNCENLESCRQQHFQKNSQKLSSEKTTARKMA